MTNSYNSRQDFATQLCRMTKPSVLDKYLPRTMRNDNDAHFGRYLHDAMGYRSHQPEI